MRPFVIFLVLLAAGLFAWAGLTPSRDNENAVLASLRSVVQSAGDAVPSISGSSDGDPAPATILQVATDPDTGTETDGNADSTPAPVIESDVEPIDGIEQPGQKFLIRAEDLPEPGATKMAVNFPRPEPMAEGDEIFLPAGFKAEVYSADVVGPRLLAVAPNGDVFVSVSGSRRQEIENSNSVWLLRDSDGDFVADKKYLFADGFDMPLGLALTSDALLVADVQGVWSLPYATGNISEIKRERITPEGALGTKVGSHYHRVIALDPNGFYMYVAAGSRGNVAEEPVPHGRIMRFKMDGSEPETFAAGLRNPVGTAFHPDTGELYTVVNERDGYGDDLVPDFFTRVEKGDFFGWPYAYSGGIPDKDLGEVRPDLVAATRMPDVLFQAHSAPIGLHFYRGKQFPAEYRGDAFVAFHGSWNRSEPTGYKLVRIRFENGRPVGGYENFLTGFLRPGEEKPRILARPTGLAELPDGSLLMAEDGNHVIWRISYQGDS